MSKHVADARLHTQLPFRVVRHVCFAKLLATKACFTEVVAPTLYPSLLFTPASGGHQALARLPPQLKGGPVLGLDVIGSITELVETLAGMGVVGLLVLAILYSVVNR